MRALSRKLHLWLGLPSAAIFMVVALTGALLVYEKDIDRALHPELWRTDAAQPALPLDALVASAEAASDGRPLREIRLYSEADAALVEVRFEQGRHAYVDPASGALLGSRTRSDSFFGVVEDIHTSLAAGPVGKWIVIASTVVLLALLLTGLVLWWPKQWRMLKNAVTLALGRRGRALHFNLHNTLGFWSALPLAAIALTGTIMGIKPLGDALRGAHREIKPPAPVSDPAYPPASYEQIRLAALDVFPASRQLRLHVPRTHDDPKQMASAKSAAGAGHASAHGPARAELRPAVWRIESVAADSPHEHGRSRAWLDPRTAAILRIDRFADLPLSARLRALARPLHDGSLFGRPSQAIALLAVLILPILSVTGVALWWLRRRAENARKRCAGLGLTRNATPSGRLAGNASRTAPRPVAAGSVS